MNPYLPPAVAGALFVPIVPDGRLLAYAAIVAAALASVALFGFVLERPVRP